MAALCDCERYHPEEFLQEPPDRCERGSAIEFTPPFSVSVRALRRRCPVGPLAVILPEHKPDGSVPLWIARMAFPGKNDFCTSWLAICSVGKALTAR